MRENSLIIKWEKDKARNLWRAKLPEEFLKSSNKEIYLTDREIPPKKLIYGNSFWIINEGHDYQKNKDTLTTSSDRVSIHNLLITWGESLKEFCTNGHKISTSQALFCPECGVKLKID